MVLGTSPRRRRRGESSSSGWLLPILGVVVVAAIAWFVGRFFFDAPPAATSPATPAPTAVALSQASTAAPRPAGEPTPRPAAASAQTAAPSPSPTPVPTPDWMITVRDTPLWSGADADAVQFTLAPAGSYVRPLSSAPTGRILVDYTGDGKARKPGQAWVSHADLAPGGPPPWIASSELDGLTASPPAPGTLTRVGYAPPPVVSAAQIAVIDEASGLLLYGLAPHEPEEPASTTKIATALVTLQKAPDLDRVVPITINGFAMASRDGSSIMGLEPGERLSLRTLLYGLLLPSGNDAAEQLALVVAPSREQYVAWMNDLVASLGLHDTHFVNPSGLDDPDHLASAYDLAQMARAAMRDQTFRTIVASPTYKAEGYVMQGHNPLLGEYPGVDGVKTGTTDLAGHAMVASATRASHRVYVVVMHSDDLLADCSALFDWVWDSFSWPAGAPTAVSNTPAIAPSRSASPSPIGR